MRGQLTVEEGESAGTVFAIEPGQTMVLGSGPSASWVVADPGVAAMHAAILFAPPDAFQAVDLGAGVTVNGEALQPRHPHEIRPGDVVGVGPGLRLRVSVEGGELASPRSQARTLRHVVEVAGGAYEIERELGSGALGRVFAARRKADGVAVAIKALHRSVPDGSDEQARFLREGRVAARIDSPYVVRVLEAVVDRQRAYLVMEQVEGRTLRDLLRDGPLPLADALGHAEDMARALLAAAQADVVHRDVKPANVFLTGEGRAKLGDFGTAKALDSSTILTQAGEGMGSLAYMAPEQVEDARDVDPRADVYALGATLYHMLAGVPPFRPASVEELEVVLDQPPPPLREQRADCPETVAELVHALLAKAPEERPPAWLVVEKLAAAREQFG